MCVRGVDIAILNFISWKIIIMPTWKWAGSNINRSIKTSIMSLLSSSQFLAGTIAHVIDIYYVK